MVFTSAFLCQALFFDLFVPPHNMADNYGIQELETFYTVCTACRDTLIRGAETLLLRQIITLGWFHEHFLELSIKHFLGHRSVAIKIF